MNIAVAIALALVPWCAAAVLLAGRIGRIVRLRDFEVDAIVATEMAGVDDEYKALVRGGAR